MLGKDAPIWLVKDAPIWLGKLFIFLIIILVICLFRDKSIFSFYMKTKNYIFFNFVYLYTVKDLKIEK